MLQALRLQGLPLLSPEDAYRAAAGAQASDDRQGLQAVLNVKSNHKVQSSNLKVQSKLKALLSSTYFGPIQWYQKLNRYDECLIERHESFIKQTYRNRMIISTANGPLSLTIPTNHNTSLAMKDIRISDHANWRHVHWNALLSAYGESPFFEYYQDDIRPFFEKKYEFLFDFNMETTEKMIELLDIRPKISITEEYVLSEERRVKSEESEERRTKSEKFDSLANHKVQSSNLKVQSIVDFRDAIRPKKPLPDAEFAHQRYYQVYEQKYGFQPNMSILDLLFNEGNEAIFYL
ncbi:WbqC family protein [Prevotella copri]|uniref:WbqC family protein n=1 Tax=Segatella copri TaxID=165179 RepID=A0A6G1VJF5_9BACT|nr:WbqC family protein [Segatella copri]MQP13675.1 WbqC family protein [Segatella copri]